MPKTRCYECGTPTYDTLCSRCAAEPDDLPGDRCVDCGRLLGPLDRGDLCAKCHINESEEEHNERD